MEQVTRKRTDPVTARRIRTWGNVVIGVALVLFLGIQFGLW